MAGYKSGSGGADMFDKEESEIKSSEAFATSYDFTDSLEVSGYQSVTIFIEVTDKGTNSGFVVKAQSTGEETPSNWSDLVSDDDITSGATAVPVYEATYDISSDSVTFRKQLNFPVRGRWIRFGIKGDAAADGAYSVTAMRQ